MRRDLTSRPRPTGLWIVAGGVLLVAVALGLRWGTAISQHDPVLDEVWITGPMAEILRHGWSVDTAIDFQETKGPSLIWPYAVWGEVFVDDRSEVVPIDVAGDGRGSNDMTAWEPPIVGGPAPAAPRMLSVFRWLSISCFIGAGILIMLLARACGLRGPPVLLVGVFYIVVPHQAVCGQLVMGEMSFVLLSLAMLLVVCWGMGDDPKSQHRVMGPVLYGLFLVLLLHSRIHAVAFAPAVCVVAWQREDLRSWPWWVASLVAGLLRIPLWVRWDGLVSSEFQNTHALGLRFDSLTYLGAAMSLPLGIFLLAWVIKWRRDALYWLPPLGVLLGIVLGVFAMPDLSIPETLDVTVVHDRFQGVVATLVSQLSTTAVPSRLVMSVICAIGLGGLGAFVCLAHRIPLTSLAGVLLRVQALTLGAGWLLYAFTSGFVFDRYLVAWTVAMPIAWVLLLPRIGQLVQAIILAIIASMMVFKWLM